MISRSTYSTLLRTLRKEHDIKQIEIANYLCMSRQAYSRYEDGKYLLSLPDLEKVSAFYGLSVTEFLNLAEILENSYADTALETEDLVSTGVLKEAVPTYGLAIPSHVKYLLTRHDEKLLRYFHILPDKARDMLISFLNELEENSLSEPSVQK